MTVSCPSCKSLFRVDPAKVPATGVRARCSVCGGVIALGGGTLPVSVTPVSSVAALPPLGSRYSHPTVPSTLPAGASWPTAESVLTPSAPAALPSATAADQPAATLTPLSSSATATPAAGKRLINPFLRADPAQRARRLARALVSDLVAYQPQKREEGLREGTLRQLFREEIKKSYEEYLEQVGRDVAEHSPHFQEALNEILAGGRRLF